MSEEHRVPSPFVGLDYYREDKAPFFFGREEDRDLIIENLRAARLTLLYGTSGVGKSSVLHAGAAYRLRQLGQEFVKAYGKPEFAVVTFREWRDDPLPGLLRSIQESVAQALQKKSVEGIPESRNLAQAIRTWTERHDVELLFILDQFEEYFLYRPQETGDGPAAKGFAAGTFAKELTSALNDAGLRAKFLISLRDDALSKLDRFKPHLPGLFDNLFRLHHLNSTAARAAIEKPLEEFSRRYAPEEKGEVIAPALVDEIIRQLQAAGQNGKGDSGDKTEADKIEAPYLQLVMERLWKKEQAEGSRTLRLETLKELKGIENIVQEYVNDVLNNLTTEQQAVAARIFDYLVRPSGDKQAYLKSDLVTKTKFSEAQVKETLESLSNSRILRPVEPPPNLPRESRYEIFHDVLGKAIQSWQTKYQQAEELAESERQRIAAARAKRYRRLWGLTAVLALLFLITLGTTIFALIQRIMARESDAYSIMSEIEARRAEGEARRAEGEARAAEAIARGAEREARTEKDKASAAEANAIRERDRAADLAIIAERREQEAIVAATEASKQKKRAEGLLKENNELNQRQSSSFIQALDEQIKKEPNPELKKKLEEIKTLFQRKFSRALSQEQENSIIEEQKRESRVGRPVQSGDQIRRKLWQNGRTLHFQFIGGNPALHKKIEQVAQEWTKYANIHFVFDSSPNAEIRIGFADPGAWSYIGTDALAIPKDQPTMNFGILANSRLSEEDFRRTVLHEFGHVFGLIHEHQNPNANIPWNKEAVYKEFEGPPNYWDRNTINANFFTQYKGDYRPKFDPQSIMMIIPIPKRFLMGNDFQPITELSSVLSESDKEFISTLYPRT